LETLYSGAFSSQFSCDFAVYELDGIGLDGEVRYFRKPWFMTTLMFMGMSFCLPLAYLEERGESQNGAATSAADEPLLAEHSNGEQPPVWPPLTPCRLPQAPM
jgi:hypothetical protein